VLTAPLELERELAQVLGAAREPRDTAAGLALHRDPAREVPQVGGGDGADAAQQLELEGPLRRRRLPRPLHERDPEQQPPLPPHPRRRLRPHFFLFFS
jgi:hypothetical protein